MEADPDYPIAALNMAEGLKPGAEEEIFAEMQAALPDRRVQRLRGGEVFEL